MNTCRWIVSALAVTLLAGPARAGWGLSIGIGLPPYGCYRPYPYGWGYYRPVVPVVVAPPPVIYPPPPVVQPVAVAGAAYPQPAPVVVEAVPSPPAGLAPPVQAAPAAPAEIERCMAHLVNPDDRARGEAVVQLGRLHATQAIDRMSRVLASDRSPQVREAAARGLGLIGNPAALPALQQAAQADDSPEVRTSARFAVDVIRSNNP